MRPEPLPAQLIVHGLVIAGCVLVILLGIRAIVTRRATGSVTWGELVPGGEDPEEPWLTAVRARTEQARRAAAAARTTEHQKKSGRMRPSA